MFRDALNAMLPSATTTRNEAPASDGSKVVIKDTDNLPTPAGEGTLQGGTQMDTSAHSTGEDVRMQNPARPELTTTTSKPVYVGGSMPAEASAGQGHNTGEDLLEVKAHEALHGGTRRLAEPYTAAVPVEKIATPLPGVTTESGTSRLAYGVEAPPSDLGAGRPI